MANIFTRKTKNMRVKKQKILQVIVLCGTMHLTKSIKLQLFFFR